MSFSSLSILYSKQRYGHRSTSLTPITSAMLCYVMFTHVIMIHFYINVVFLHPVISFAFRDFGVNPCNEYYLDEIPVVSQCTVILQITAGNLAKYYQP